MAFWDFPESLSTKITLLLRIASISRTNFTCRALAGASYRDRACQPIIFGNCAEVRAANPTKSNISNLVSRNIDRTTFSAFQKIGSH